MRVYLCFKNVNFCDITIIRTFVIFLEESYLQFTSLLLLFFLSLLTPESKITLSFGKPRSQQPVVICSLVLYLSVTRHLKGSRRDTLLLTSNAHRQLSKDQWHSCHARPTQFAS